MSLTAQHHGCSRCNPRTGVSSLRALLCGLALLIPCAGGAEQPLFDFAYAYDMRQTTQERDGDVTYLMIGRSATEADITTRFEAGLGFRNEFWGESYPPAGRAGFSASRAHATGRAGLGGNIRLAEGEWSGLDLAYGASLEHGQSGFRTLSGLQFLTTDDYFETGRRVSAFWLAEGSFWLTPNMAFRGSIGGDDGSHIVSVSTALGRPGWPIALEADLTVGLPEYRGNAEHSDLFIGLRWLGPDRLRSTSLRAREVERDIRLFYRPTEPG